MQANYVILAKKPALLPQHLNVDSSLILGRSAIPCVESLITIAIPTFRRPELLTHALRSAVEQRTIHHYEILVVDNDDSAEFSKDIEACIAQFKSTSIMLFRNRKNVGMYGNWNRCLTLASSPWVTILNDDDLLAPDFIQCICDLVGKYPEAGLLQTGYKVYDKRKFQVAPQMGNWDGFGGNKNKTAQKIDLKRLCLGNTRAGSLGMVYRRDLALEIGGFNEIDFPTADYCFNLRLIANNCIGYEVTEPLSTYLVFENESLKPMVLTGFIVNDYHLRLEAAIHFYMPVWLVKFYARMTAIAYFYRLKKTWKISPDADVLKEQLGITTHNSMMESFITRLVSKTLKKVII